MMEFNQEEGLRFHPNDSELLKFLLRFIAEKDLRDNGFITVLDMYQREPCVNYGIGRHCGGEKDGLRYFLSPRHHKKEQGGERFCRIVGGNKKIRNWKLLNKGKEVVLNYQNLVITGMKNSLYFENKSKSCEGKWLMKEYSFSGESLKKLTKSKLKNYCICAIRKSNRKSFYGFGQIQDMEETPVSVGNPVMEESPVSLGNSAMEEIQKDDGTQESAKAKVKERMEKAFLDGVMKQDNPILRWVLKRMKEVQNELCEMSPPNWRQEILETVDIDILSEVLKSGTLDMYYFGRILEFVLVTLRKLSAPSIEDELKAYHQKFLKELGENTQGGENSSSLFTSLVIKGLQFVIRQIKKLKGEISKACIKLLEPLIKGPAGFEYLRSSFSNCYGLPTEAPISLPLVKQWLSSVMLVADQEWDDHLTSLSSLRLSSGAHSLEKAPITLRAGGNCLRISDPPTLKTNATEQRECKGEKVDLILRLGLLHLVCEIEGLTVETLPETLKLNFSKLRAVQAFLQKIIVICTSILVLRQTLLAECLVTNPSDREDILSKSVTKLLKLLDKGEGASITKVVEKLSLCLEGDEPEKLQARKEIMANMLAKSLRAGDAIFTRVSGTVFLAAKAILLCRSGAEGRRLAENTLKSVGATLLTEKLVEATEDLLVVATMSAKVHGSWYLEVLKNMRAL